MVGITEPERIIGNALTADYPERRDLLDERPARLQCASICA